MKNKKNDKKPSIVFMGSKPGSVVALSILLQKNWNIKYVLTTKHISDTWCNSNTLAKKASDNDIPLISQKKLPLDKDIDFVISYMFRYRVKPEVISLAKRAALNFHPAPLPEFSGWRGYNIAILENVKKFGCTCHHMINEFDAGPIMKTRYFTIEPQNETAYSLEKKTQKEMIRLFIDFCNIAERKNKIPKTPQKIENRKYLTIDELENLKKIPNSTDSETIDRYSRAFWFPPYMGAYIEINNNKIEVVPKIARENLGDIVHQNDIEILNDVALKYY